ncbi:hypothetical protein [Streptomyces daliensis]
MTKHTTPGLTITELKSYNKPFMPLWPDFGALASQAESTTY